MAETVSPNLNQVIIYKASIKMPYIKLQLSTKQAADISKDSALLGITKQNETAD